MKNREIKINDISLTSNENVYMFESTFFHILPTRYLKNFSVIERLKLHLRAIQGYYFYSLDIDDNLAAYCFLKRNYFRKYEFLHNDDVLINPYYVSTKYRGNAYGRKLLKIILNNKISNLNRIWAVVAENNIPSIKTLQHLDFQRKGYSIKSFWSHRLTNMPTNLIVFVYNSLS